MVSMTGSPPDVDRIGTDELRRLLIEALGKVAGLAAENAALREEIARLKGLKGRPSIKPSGRERASEPKPPTGAGRRRGRSGKQMRRVAIEDRVLKAEVPTGSRFKGYESFLIQDLVLRPIAIRYRRERWMTPDGRTVVAPLPPGIDGHFGPELRRFVLAQYHQGQVTVPRLVVLLEAIGIEVSKRQLVRLLIGRQGRFLDEAREVLRAGLETAAWVTVDDTGARHKAANGYCTQIGNQAVNAYGRQGGPKSGRGGRSLLVGLMACARCGRRLKVAYRGRYPYPIDQCMGANEVFGVSRCMSFAGQRIDRAIARELIRAIEPMAIEAALSAERMHMESQAEQQRLLELELQQARYEASLAERRYAACDPDNRLIAATLEKNWEETLRRVQECEARLDTARAPKATTAQPNFAGLAEDLEAAWKSPLVTMRTRQQLLRSLVNEIIADVDPVAHEIVFTIHWKGGRHSQLRLRKPQSGEHDCRTSDEAIAVIQSMASRWSDEDIAATLNRMRMPTGQGKTWTAHRVGSIRRVRGIHAYRSAEKTGEWLTLTEAACQCRVNFPHMCRSKIPQFCDQPAG